MYGDIFEVRLTNSSLHLDRFFDLLYGQGMRQYIGVDMEWGET